MSFSANNCQMSLSLLQYEALYISGSIASAALFTAGACIFHGCLDHPAIISDHRTYFFPQSLFRQCFRDTSPTVANGNMQLFFNDSSGKPPRFFGLVRIGVVAYIQHSFRDSAGCQMLGLSNVYFIA